MLSNLKIGKRLILIVIAMFFGMAAIGGIGLVNLKDNLLRDRQAQTKFCVDLGFDPNSKYVDGARLKEKMNSDKASIALETLRPSVQGRVEEPGESETE